MTNFIIKNFVKNYYNVRDPEVRKSYGTTSSIVGIIVNIILSLSKISVGAMFNSISVMADGVNNLSDAGSSVISLVGFKISGKPADKDHPFGHARIEYLTGLILGIAILLVGYELLKTSFMKVINPEKTIYSTAMLIVLAISIGGKLWLSRFYSVLGDKISSATIKASSADSRNDVIATCAVFLSAVVAMGTGLEIDGYIGILVALFILYSGVSILRDILNPLLGEMPETDLVDMLEKKILSYEGILNIHDLVVHNYGPNRYFATVHAEVNAKEDILKSHDLIDNIERDVARDCDVNLVIHLDPIITDDAEINKLRCMTGKIIRAIDDKLTMHDFRVVRGDTHTNLIFDVLVPVDYDEAADMLVKKIEKAVREENPTFYAVVTVDRNYVSTYVNNPYLK
ncbi:MAG: cation diffusion facilitator family transporter [Sedimentibacter sp.]|uniref:cation diffusion facilitator family transporter n=1 Tax=Sedimentibacter sp. TaxID=1960295 RepID=UPI003158010B